MQTIMVDRKIAPLITVPKDIKVKIEEKVTSNGGVDLYKLPFAEYDVIKLSLVFKAGVKYQNRPFNSTSVASMLSEGCEKYNSKEIADILDFYGIYFDQSVDRDYAIITVCSLGRFVDKSIDILSSILLSPTFPESEFEVFRMRRKQNISIQRSKIDYAAREHFAKAMYGEMHPYGASYTEEQYDSLKVEHLKEFFDKHYTRKNMFVVCSGKIDQQTTEKIFNFVDRLPQGERVEFSPVEPKQKKSVEVAWKDENLQSAIRVGRLLFPRTHPDFVPMQVLCMTLGGYFGSRLISNLREDKGYTYSIFAAMINMEDSGYLAITTEVEQSVSEDAVEQIFVEVERLRNELIPEEELSMVKNVMVGEIMRILDGPFGIADITIENILTKRSNSHLLENIKAIEEITSEQLLEIARKYLSRDNFIIVVVGGQIGKD